jgi:2-polyprenyl-3-methyl-5-hydroxy-6-metoxy-1,4-benzoquinol methylase
MRTALLILAHSVPAAEVVRTVKLLESCVARVDEIVLFADAENKTAILAALANAGLTSSPAIFRFESRRYGYGGHRKIAFEYAVQRGFDAVAVGDAGAGQPLEAVPVLFQSLESSQADLLVASCGADSAGAWLLRAILGIRIRDWNSGLRALRRGVLERIPFHLCADDWSFDTEILIQARILGARLVELPVAGFENRAARPGMLFPAWGSVCAALSYRLHQLHVTRRGQFLIAPQVRYQFKRSPYGSHMQILGAIQPHTRVLDLGCSQGLLAGPLAAKQVHVTGVDLGAPAGVSEQLQSYYRHDLEQPLALPEGRSFDYVVVADVIEHLQQRAELLRSARCHLKPGGRLIISTPNIAIWFYRLSLLAGRFEYGPRGVLDETHLHLFTRTTFRREIERSGFRVMHERVTTLPFEVVFESTGQSRLIRALSAAYYLLARMWPEMFAYQFLIEAEFTPQHDPALDGFLSASVPT